MTKSISLRFPRKCPSSPTPNQVGALHFCAPSYLNSLKILSCLANTGQDIDSLSFGCEWLFVKSIDSAELLCVLRICCFCCWILKIKGDLLVIGSLFRLLLGLNSMLQSWENRKKNDCFHHHGVLLDVPPAPNRSLSYREKRLCHRWFLDMLSGIGFTSLSLRHRPPHLQPCSPLLEKASSARKMNSCDLLWLCLLDNSKITDKSGCRDLDKHDFAM